MLPLALALTLALGRIADVWGPTWAKTHPTAVLAANANDVHCLLTTTAMPRARWFAVAMLRRTGEDVLVFAVVRKHGRNALAAVRRMLGGPTRDDGADVPPNANAASALSLGAALVVPNAATLAVAGFNNRKLGTAAFACAVAAATALRLVALRAAGASSWGSFALAAAHSAIAEHGAAVTAVAAAASLAPLLWVR